MTRPRPHGTEPVPSDPSDPDSTNVSRVTAIRAAGDQPGLVELEIDGVVAGVLPKADVDLNEITAGLPSDDPRVVEARQAIEIRATRMLALDLLARRGHAATELLAKLRKREVSVLVASLVIEEMIEDGWLDDAAFARSRISNWRAEGKSEAHCRQQLTKAGVSDALITTSLLEPALIEQVSSPEQDAANESLVRIRRSIQGSDAASIRKIAARMARRGFELDTIRIALRQYELDDSMLDEDFDPEPDA